MSTTRSRGTWLAPVAVALWAAAIAASTRPEPQPRGVQFIFTSDAHYGLTRPAFRGATDVNAHVVNAALVARMNALPAARFPNDGGVRAGETIGSFDFVAEGGDIANRAENLSGRQVQSPSASWRQFIADYVEGIHLTEPDGHRTAVLMVPGNHDVSNAVGFYKRMVPAIDNGPVIDLFNRMIVPPVAKTAATYDVRRDRVFYTRDVGGVHFVFLDVWPDSEMRTRLDADLKHTNVATPVVLVTHDQPDAEAKHFRNPNGAHDINARDRFENLLADTFADGTTIEDESLVEQRALERFVKAHPQIRAYFHGNSNWNEFYDWPGPDHTIALHTFRVDSPMKGAASALDETKLSFQVVTISPSGQLTVRECLWNADPHHAGGAVRWGASATVRLRQVVSTN